MLSQLVSLPDCLPVRLPPLREGDVFVCAREMQNYELDSAAMMMTNHMVGIRAHRTMKNYGEIKINTST